jgi:hypothetical protein
MRRGRPCDALPRVGTLQCQTTTPAERALKPSKLKPPNSRHPDGQVRTGGIMYALSASIMVVALAGSVFPGQSVSAKREPTRFLGQTLDEHFQCGHELPRRCTEAIKLTFGSTNGPTSLAVDFVTRFERPGASNPPTTIELLVTLSNPNVNGTETPGLTLRLDRRPYPLATRVDDRGAMVAFVPFTDFVRLTNSPTVTGRAFDREFAASAKQMAVLRLVAGRWAVGASMFSKGEGG